MSSKKKNDAEKKLNQQKIEEQNIEEENFAFLVEINDEHDHECDCGDDECDCEDAVIIAKIVKNEDGEEEYIEPTEEEFDAVQKAYEELLSDEEE